MIGGLQLVELLLSKASSDLKPSFRREGVLHEIEILASRQLISRQKEKEKEKEKAKDDAAVSIESSEVPPPAPSASSRRGHTLDPEDAYTLRARVIRFKYMSSDADAERDPVYMRLRGLVEQIRMKDTSIDQLHTVLRELAELFCSTHTSVSSFELLQSGLVGALLDLALSKDNNGKVFSYAEENSMVLYLYVVNIEMRQKLILDHLAPYKDGKPSSGPSPLSILVKKLQECLTRMEPFEVATVSSAEGEIKCIAWQSLFLIAI